MSCIGQRRSFTGDLLPVTSTIDPPPSEPPCSLQLEAWLRHHSTHSTQAATHTATAAHSPRTHGGAQQGHAAQTPMPSDAVAAVNAMLQRLADNKRARAAWLAAAGDAGAQDAGRRATSPAPAAVVVVGATGARGAAKHRGSDAGSVFDHGAGSEYGGEGGDDGSVTVLGSLLNVLGRTLEPSLALIVQGTRHTHAHTYTRARTLHPANSLAVVQMRVRSLL